MTHAELSRALTAMATAAERGPLYLDAKLLQALRDAAAALSDQGNLHQAVWPYVGQQCDGRHDAPACGDPNCWQSKAAVEVRPVVLKERTEGEKAAYLQGVELGKKLYAASSVPLSDAMEELCRALAVIGVVGQIDGHDVIRRESVLEIARRRIKATP
jgi:hypothetical protein